ncbi:MAG TPA: MFS transporter, partial [Steroidobacter sp.]|nr:MFS transporter [Steroidobacter sp.]
TDRHSLYAAAFVRSVATGMVGVLLGVYLAQLNLSTETIGVTVSSGLAGALLSTLVTTFLADRIGHRRSLLALSSLSFIGGIGFAASSHQLVLAAAAFIGMINGMGRDRGAALVLEQAVLPATTSSAERTMAFAQYNVLQDVGHAVGALMAGLPALFERSNAAAEALAFRFSIVAYAVLCLLPCIAYLRLSPRIEQSGLGKTVRVAPSSRRILWKISLLFAIDSIAGGFLTAALLSFFFYERFGVRVESIAALFFFARVANAGSHMLAAWLAKRIGLVNTMVFTHIPSSLLLVTVAFAPNFTVAAILFLLRESLVEMDVPTRQSYVMAVVDRSERTLASGVTHLVRLGGWAIAPAFAGVLMSGSLLAIPLFVGAGMKILYDVLLWRAFRGIQPPEEREGSNSVADRNKQSV